MRKIFFVLFGVVFVALILLVDWSEKFRAVTDKLPEQVWPFQQKPDTTATPIPTDLILPELPPEITAFAEAQESLPITPSIGPEITTVPAQSKEPTEQAKLPPVVNRFDDIPEKPYKNESRELIQKTIQNYNRIRQTNSTIKQSNLN